MKYNYLFSIFLCPFAICVITTCGGSKPAPLSLVCPSSLTGNPWAPSVSGIGAQNHNPSVTVTQTVYGPVNGSVYGLNQGVPESGEVVFTIPMPSDLGANGSIALNAEVVNYPSYLSGSAFAFLVSLSPNGGTTDWINLARSGVSGDCTTTGYYTCSGGTCSPNPGCTVSWPSSYTDRNNWEEHQAQNSSAVNDVSMNLFPTCNWTAGSGGNPTWPACAFNQNFFPSSPTPQRLPFGSSVNYQARYALVADSYATLPSETTAQIQLTVIKKSDNTTPFQGAFDLNVILTGTTVVSSSRTPKGQQNLNTLISNLVQTYTQSNPNIKIGIVTPIEWTCDMGGDNFADIDVSQIGTMFSQTQTLVPSPRAGGVVNLFLVNSITDDSNPNSPFIILGYDGAIGAPQVTGSASSGAVVALLDNLTNYNPTCNQTPCPVTTQDSDFFTLSETMAHEIGHYFGLNHPTEYDLSQNDPVYDTPICQTQENIGGVNMITINSCVSSQESTDYYLPNGLTCPGVCTSYNPSVGQFCSSTIECEFNYTMWWTTKNYYQPNGTSDGLMYSPEESAVMHYNPIAY